MGIGITTVARAAMIGWPLRGWLRGLAVLAAVASVVASVGACGASEQSLQTARDAAYDIDYAQVHYQVIDAIEAHYPEFAEDPAARGLDPLGGRLETAWFPVRLATDGDAPIAARAGAGAGAGAGVGLVGGSGREQRRFYIRFDIEIVGGRPWQVLIAGQASSWELGQGAPVVLSGSDEPPWVAGRVDALQLAVYQRLERYVSASAGADLDRATSAEDEPPALALAGLEALPRSARAAVSGVYQAARAGTVEALRPHLADELVWSRGAPPSARQALIVWQADPARFERLADTIAAGCAVVGGAGDNQIECPAAAPEAGAGGAEVRFERGADGRWLMTRFVDTEGAGP